MGTLLQDLRYGLRMLAKNPGFTAVAVIALALGIGPNTAIFSVVNTVLLRPLPYRNLDHLVMVWERNLKAKETEHLHLSGPDFLDWKEQNRVFEEVAASGDVAGVYSLAVSQGERPELLRAASISSNFFSFLGIRPALGRPFLPDEEHTRNSHVVILSHSLWQRRFGGQKDIVGKAVTLSGESYDVVGVTSPEFRMVPMGEVDLFLPVVFDAEQMQRRDVQTLHFMGRLKPGITLARAQADMDTIARRLTQTYPQTNRDRGADVVPLTKLESFIRPTLYMLLGAVALVLLVACGNVANLLLARSLTRQKEFAVRAAVGAGRLRLVRQLLTESLLLASAGCALGLFFAWWGVGLLTKLGTQNIPYAQTVSIDSRVVAFALAVSGLTALAFGLLPALQSSNPDLNDALKEGSRGSGVSWRRQRTRGGLVIAQLALALVVLAGAGLLVRSFLRLANTDPGFRLDNVLTLELPLAPPKYKAASQFGTFYEQLLARVRSVPGIQAASLTSTLPLGYAAAISSHVSVPGQPPASVDQSFAMTRVLTPGYFNAIGMALLKGRDFTDRDTASATRVAVVNQTLARQLFPGVDNPVGKTLMILPETNYEPRRLASGALEIVGLVANVKHWFIGGDPHDDEEIYVPYQQHPQAMMTLVVQAASSSAGLGSALRGAVAALDPELASYDFETLRDQLAETVAPRRFYPLLLSLFAGIALVLASVGVYGVMSYSVAERTHEIGIRLALGAERRDVMRLVIGRGLVLTLIGITVGVLGALVATRLLSDLLFGVSPTDFLTFALVSLLLTAVAFAATYVPARRATKVDPMVALRYE